MKINVSHIDSTWPTCDYKLRVFVDVADVVFVGERFNYVLRTLQKWFGAAEYYWTDKGEACFLCIKSN